MFYTKEIWPSAEELRSHLDTLSVGEKENIVLTSGGYDVPHFGHTRCIRSAAMYGKILIVIVNGDGFLMRKKGYVVMPLEQRLEIIAAIKGVDYVIPWDDGTQYVDGAIRILKPKIFAKGGDRSDMEHVAAEEQLACIETGTLMYLGVGGFDKIQSSSVLAKNMKGG